jgi:hypothetical protein
MTTCMISVTDRVTTSRAKRRRQRIVSHRLSVEVEAQESFLGTGGSECTEQRATYYDTIGT